MDLNDVYDVKGGHLSQNFFCTISVLINNQPHLIPSQFFPKLHQIEAFIKTNKMTYDLALVLTIELNGLSSQGCVVALSGAPRRRR